MREEVFRVKSQKGKRRQNILVGVAVGALAGVVMGALADYKDDVDGSDRGSNNGKLGGSVFGAGVGAGIGSLVAGHRVIYRPDSNLPSLSPSILKMPNSAPR